MTEDFCNRTARRTRKLGYAPKVAVRIARFCYIFMLFLRGLMGPFGVSSYGLNYISSGSGKFSPGARAGMISPVSSGIRH